MFFFRNRVTGLQVDIVGELRTECSRNPILKFTYEGRQAYGKLAVPVMRWIEHKGFNEYELKELENWAARMLILISHTWEEITGEGL